jgi:hypothetical protein
MSVGIHVGSKATNVRHSLDGKVGVITGGTQGTGLAIAEESVPKVSAGGVSDSLRMRGVDSDRLGVKWVDPSVPGRIDSAWVPCRFAV